MEKNDLSIQYQPESDAMRTVRAHTSAIAQKIGEKPGVYIQTFGCQQNEADSEHLAGMALDMGYQTVDRAEDAYLIVFNTCAVREHAELKALSLTGQLKKLKEARPELIIAICGCMVAQEHRIQKIKQSYPYVDFLFGTSQHHRFPEFLAQELTYGRRAFYEDPERAEIAEGMPVRRESNFRAWVSIMYGCNNFCTYCVVPYVRGRERSRAKEDILREIRALAEEGYREITLLGQNVNSYGKDRYEDYGFADLLEDICTIRGEYWIRFMTSHPKDATHRLIDVMAAHSSPDSAPRIVRNFHLPVQSGSNAVLRDMNRHYTREKYIELVDYMRSKMPDISLSTDMIVGFPTESEADFEETLSLLQQIRYDSFFSFIFSPRAGTPAAEMPQLPEQVTAKRFAEMLAIQNAISNQKNQEMLGRIETVLVEGRSKTDARFLTGRNEHNRLIHFEGSDPLIGNFAKVKVTAAETYFVSGVLIEPKNREEHENDTDDAAVSGD